MSKEKIGKVQGGRTHKSYVVYWDPQSRHVYVEIPGGLFSGSSIRDINNITSSAGMAMHAAEAYCFDK